MCDYASGEQLVNYDYSMNGIGNDYEMVGHMMDDRKDDDAGSGFSCVI